MSRQSTIFCTTSCDIVAHKLAAPARAHPQRVRALHATLPRCRPQTTAQSAHIRHMMGVTDDWICVQLNCNLCVCFYVCVCVCVGASYIPFNRSTYFTGSLESDEFQTARERRRDAPTTALSAYLR